MTNSLLNGLRILSVENDALNAEAMKCLLEVQGAIVLGPVPDVAAALALLNAATPELALVDYRLDGETIDSVIDTLKAKDIPFLMVTACAPCLMTPEYAALPTVFKPFMIDALVSAISVVLKKPRIGLAEIPHNETSAALVQVAS